MIKITKEPQLSADVEDALKKLGNYKVTVGYVDKDKVVRGNIKDLASYFVIKQHIQSQASEIERLKAQLKENDNNER